MKIKYRSNNSGGSWWLTDANWFALEKAGWKVNWEKDEKDPIFQNNGRCLGALATSAEKEFNSVKQAIKEFEKITGCNLSDEGCNCCGPPHSFIVENDGETDYIDGSDFLEYIYKKIPSSIREACEMLDIDGD